MDDKAPPGAASSVVRRRGIDRVVLLLEALLREGRPMGAGELARRLDAPRSTTYEIVNSLVGAGMLEAGGGEGQVYFGPAMHLYGRAYAQENAQARRVAEAMDELSRQTGETVQLCGLRGDKYAVFDSRDAAGPFRITSHIGMTVPIPWTASGPLLLAHMSRGEAAAFIPDEDYRLPDGRLVSPDAFLAGIEKGRDEGFSEATGLADRFTLCMAAPIRDAAGRVSRTLCLVMPAGVASPRRDELRALLCRQAQHLSLGSA